MRNVLISAAFLGSVAFIAPQAHADDAGTPRDPTPGVVVPPMELPPPDNNAVIEHRTPDCETTDTEGQTDKDARKDDKGEKKICK
jgi:hypothetical protein